MKGLLLFFNTSKIQFESKSQLLGSMPFLINSCFSIRQRYNLKANHNLSWRVKWGETVVFQYVKDTIWKQITTCWPKLLKNLELFFNTSKIQFESKSQLSPLPIWWIPVVFQYVKDTIWKQITTPHSLYFQFGVLFFNTSKIQFESKSQRSQNRTENVLCCFSIRQRYNLKANHNRSWIRGLTLFVVFQYVKDTIWKQITTLWVGKPWRARVVFQYVKDTIWKQITTVSASKSPLKCCFSIRQRYNLKANHNNRHALAKLDSVVFQYVKDTIWKQITTLAKSRKKSKVLFFNTSKIQFESKSQLSMQLRENGKCCFSIRQRYNLKANHNYKPIIKFWAYVVFQYVKDTIWKQITTCSSGAYSTTTLFFNTSKIQFESKSQLCWPKEASLLLLFFNTSKIQFESKSQPYFVSSM